MNKEVVMKILLKHRPPLSMDDVLDISDEIVKISEAEKAKAVAKVIRSKKHSPKSSHPNDRRNVRTNLHGRK